MNIKYLISSKVNIQTGKLESNNCYGFEKVKRFYERFGDISINKFYSDSLSDEPMSKLAKESFIVNKDTIIPWNEYDEKIKASPLKIFVSKQFVLFVLIGGINVVSGIIFSSLFSLMLSNINASFFLGYVTSLIISYFLNTCFVFLQNLSFFRFIKFCVSYIPNFLFQNIIIFILQTVDKTVRDVISANRFLPISKLPVSLDSCSQIRG